MTTKLYGFPMSPNSRRAQLALEEVGAPYVYVTVDLMQGQNRAPEHLALNPNAKVPVLVDDDVVLWESHAILLYLAAKHPEKRLGGESPAEIGAVAKWCFLNASHLGPALAGLFAHSIRLPEDKRVPQIAENGRAEATRIFAVLDDALRDRTWLAGDRFTLADLSLGPNVLFAPMLGFDLASYPNVAAWAKRLGERPSFKKVMG